MQSFLNFSICNSKKSPIFSDVLKVHISKPSDASDDDERESEDSDEERCTDKSMDGDSDAEGSDGQSEEPVIRCGVTPFLTRALRAGKLRARPKPAGCQAYGLIQVRLKDEPFNSNVITVVLPGVELHYLCIPFFLPGKR